MLSASGRKSEYKGPVVGREPGLVELQQRGQGGWSRVRGQEHKMSAEGKLDAGW